MSHKINTWYQKAQFRELADDVMLSIVGERHDGICKMLSLFLHYKAHTTRLVHDIY